MESREWRSEKEKSTNRRKEKEEAVQTISNNTNEGNEGEERIIENREKGIKIKWKIQK